MLCEPQHSIMRHELLNISRIRTSGGGSQSVSVACLTRYEQEGFATLRPRTARLYRRLMATLRAHLGAERVSGLNPLAIERYRHTRLAEAQVHGYGGQTTVNREIAWLSAVIDRCQVWGLHTRTDNPCTEIKAYTESRNRERVLTVSEETALLATLPAGPMRLVTQLGLECGARVASELLPLQWDAVDLDGGRLHIAASDSKNRKGRWLPLSQGMVEALRTHQAHRHPSPLVFCTARGLFLHRYRGAFFKAVKTAGLGGTGVNVHCLRHTFASRLMAATGNPVLVKELLGHASLTTTMRYAHLAPNAGPAGIAAMLAARAAATSDQEHPHQSPTAIRGGRRTS
jgi:integrase